MSKIQDLYQKVVGYLNDEYIVNLLQKRLKNIEDENYLIEKSDLKKIMNLDEYFYLLMKETKYISSDRYLKRYLTEISKELYTQPLLLLELPMYQLDKNILRQYLPNYDYVINKIKAKEIEANNIYRKLINTTNRVSYQELNELVRYLSFSIPYADSKMFNAQEQVAKHLLNLGIDTTYNYNFSLYLIKFFGYKKIREDKLNDTKILVCKLDPNINGESTENFAIINKTLLRKVTMENNRLYDKFGATNKMETVQNGVARVFSKVEVLGVLHTLYHEIRHQKQKQHSSSSNVDDLSYYYAAYEIINRNNKFDYKENYKCYEIEKDANYKAWEDIEKLIKTYMPGQDIERTMKNILQHKLKEELEQITGIRRTEDNKKYISSSLLIQYLDQKIRYNRYMQNNNYKQFKTFYDSYGNPKRTIELLKLPLIYDFRDFYFIQVNYRSKISTSKITRMDLKYLSQDELKIIINNIKILMNTTREKMGKIRDRVDKYNDSTDEIIANLQNYYNFSIHLSNIVNELLILYPTMSNTLSIRNAIDSINLNIDMINNNSLVIKRISGNSKISRVGKR